MNLHDGRLFSLETHHDLRQPVMCNMPKSMRMSRQAFSLRKVRSTNKAESKMKSDLKSAWIYPRTLEVGPLHSRRHCSKLHALQTCPSPRFDNRPLSAQVPVNASFRQASPDNLCCVHPHVILDPSSFNTVCTLNSGCLWLLRFVSVWLE